jgi:uncharacterized membrane protein
LSHIGWFGSNFTMKAEIIAGAPEFNSFVLWLHVVTALPPLLIGPWGFVRGVFRTRLRPLHRWMGLAYVYFIFVSAITGFALALVNPFGWFARAGFSLLAIVWFFTTWFAYQAARNKDFRTHREWMIRSFLVTMAVVTVRLLPTPEGVALANWFPWLTWLCWVPNLIAAEIYIRISTFKGEYREPDWAKGIRLSREERMAVEEV